MGWSRSVLRGFWARNGRFSISRRWGDVAGGVAVGISAPGCAGADEVAGAPAAGADVEAEGDGCPPTGGAGSGEASESTIGTVSICTLSAGSVPLLRPTALGGDLRLRFDQWRPSE